MQDTLWRMLFALPLLLGYFWCVYSRLLLLASTYFYLLLLTVMHLADGFVWRPRGAVAPGNGPLPAARCGYQRAHHHHRRGRLQSPTPLTHTYAYAYSYACKHNHQHTYEHAYEHAYKHTYIRANLFIPIEAIGSRALQLIPFPSNSSSILVSSKGVTSKGSRPLQPLPLPSTNVSMRASRAPLLTLIACTSVSYTYTHLYFYLYFYSYLYLYIYVYSHLYPAQV